VKARFFHDSRVGAVLSQKKSHFHDLSIIEQDYLK